MTSGFFVNGPYALITTAVSADLGTHASLAGNEKALATVTAIIDGMGSVGAALGPLATGYISEMPGGFDNVFFMLYGAATCAGGSFWTQSRYWVVGFTFVSLKESAILVSFCNHTEPNFPLKNPLQPIPGLLLSGITVREVRDQWRRRNAPPSRLPATAEEARALLTGEDMVNSASFSFLPPGGTGVDSARSMVDNETGALAENRRGVSWKEAA
jgi:MFS family permease